MRRGRAAAVFLTGVALALAAREARAFCRSTTCRGDCPADDQGCPSTGLPLYWPTACVGFSLQKNGTQSLDLEGTRIAIQKSFEAWSEVPCPSAGGKFSSITFSELGDADCHKSQYNGGGPNVNVVLFQDNDWTYKGIDGTLAKTAVTYDDTTGEIFDADIEVNAAFNNLTITDTQIGYDLRSIVTHEVGHFIGLAHSPDPAATMFATYAPGTFSGRQLSKDDVAAVCAVYPPGRPGACDTTPRGGFSGTCADPQKSGCAVADAPASGGPLVLVPFGAIALFVRRRRRGRVVSARVVLECPRP